MIKKNPVWYKMQVLSLALILLASTTSLTRGADDVAWPKVIKNEKGELTVYQPQPESLNGTLLAGRAAISVKLADSKRPVFGAIWITTTLVVDRDTRIATMTNIRVPNIRFSDDIDSTGQYKLRKLIEEEMPKWNMEVSVDNIIATLENSSTGSKEQFRNDPPEIIVAYKPSIFVFVDGDPVIKEMEGYDFKRIENSPYFIIMDPKTRIYYLYGDKIWFSASDILGSWTYIEKPSSSLSKLQADIEKAKADQGDPGVSPSAAGTNVIPEVIVRKSPAELIEIIGEPEFVPIKGTNLLYVKNSENNIFMDINSQNYFILVSGRWYFSESMDGPWSFKEAEELPGDFEKIPEGSERDVVLASVPGTEASKEAILDSQIPQTAEIDRSTATVTVEYDGEPKFEKVDGTSMLYAVNSPQTVLKLSNKYYCVDNGVWFEASNPKGPWQVATERPGEVEQIKPSSPVYNVKYVYIYDVTPTVVYVGYTPGYYGCYVYGPTVIYGTGYYYRPWYGVYYYPRPVTYGFRMTYNPWTGWGMSVGISYGGWFHIGYGGGYHGGYWGPPAYRPPYYRYPPGGYYGGGRRPVHYGNTTVNVNRNIYANNRQGVNPSVARPSTRPSTGSRDVSPSRRDNNVYTDKNGNVYQQTNKGWQTREDNSWKKVDDKATTREATRPSTGNTTRPATGNTTRPTTGNTTRPVNQPSTRPATGNTTRPTNPSTFDRSSMDQASQDRNRGTVRTNNYNNFSGSAGATARPIPSRPTGGAGAVKRR